MVKQARSVGKTRLKEALDAIPSLYHLNDKAHEFVKWRKDTETTIDYTFGESSKNAEAFRDIQFYPGMFVSTWPYEPSPSIPKAYREGLETADAVLQSMIKEIEDYGDDDPQERDPQRMGENDERRHAGLIEALKRSAPK